MNIREQRVLVKEVVYSCKRLGVSLQVKTDARGNKKDKASSNIKANINPWMKQNKEDREHSPQASSIQSQNYTDRTKACSRQSKPLLTSGTGRKPGCCLEEVSTGVTVQFTVFLSPLLSLTFKNCGYRVKKVKVKQNILKVCTSKDLLT